MISKVFLMTIPPLILASQISDSGDNSPEEEKGKETDPTLSLISSFSSHKDSMKMFKSQEFELNDACHPFASQLARCEKVKVTFSEEYGIETINGATTAFVEHHKESILAWCLSPHKQAHTPLRGGINVYRQNATEDEFPMATFTDVLYAETRKLFHSKTGQYNYYPAYKKEGKHRILGAPKRNKKEPLNSEYPRFGCGNDRSGYWCDGTILTPNAHAAHMAPGIRHSECNMKIKYRVLECSFVSPGADGDQKDVLTIHAEAYHYPSLCHERENRGVTAKYKIEVPIKQLDENLSQPKKGEWNTSSEDCQIKIVWTSHWGSPVERDIVLADPCVVTFKTSCTLEFELPPPEAEGCCVIL